MFHARPPLRIALLLGAAFITCGLGRTAAAASITGTVRAQGPTPPAEAGDNGGDYGSRRYKFIERLDYSELTEFVVWIELPVPEASLPHPRPVGQIVQRDGGFFPRVLPVLVGSTVEWPNQDTIYHNVFSVSEATPFDLGLYKSGDTPRRVTFEQVGRVDVFCSIHTRMNCIVLVLPNPWFAATDARGRYTIRDVPPGTYQLKAWHERLPAQIRTVTVPATGDTTADFLLGFTGGAAGH